MLLCFFFQPYFAYKIFFYTRQCKTLTNFGKSSETNYLTSSLMQQNNEFLMPWRKIFHLNFVAVFFLEFSIKFPDAYAVIIFFKVSIGLVKMYILVKNLISEKFFLSCGEIMLQGVENLFSSYSLLSSRFPDSSIW